MLFMCLPYIQQLFCLYLISHNTETTGEENDIDSSVIVQCSAGKCWVLHSWGCYIDTYSPPNHCCRLNTALFGLPNHSSLLQKDTVYDICSRMTWQNMTKSSRAQNFQNSSLIEHPQNAQQQGQFREGPPFNLEDPKDQVEPTQCLGDSFIVVAN